MDGQCREPHPRPRVNAAAAMPPRLRAFGVDTGVEQPPSAPAHASVDDTIAWAVAVGASAPLPGHGRTRERWELLSATSEADVACARVLEPHLDALAIIDEAGVAAPAGAGPDSSWGVFAAERADLRLMARREGGEWVLYGTKPWCSLAARLSHALVTAWVDADERRLFAVDLRHVGVSAHDGPWVSRGLAEIVSAPVDFDAVPAVPVGEAEWYRRRRGFAWGGMGVAAVWWGGCLPLVAALGAAARRPGADQVAQALLGAADAAAWAARAVLDEAADAVDEGVRGDDADVLAERVRAVVAGAAERILEAADHGLGPGPLTTDDAHARRVGDLRIYLRQHHAERDLARLGRMVAAG